MRKSKGILGGFPVGTERTFGREKSLPWGVRAGNSLCRSDDRGDGASREKGTSLMPTWEETSILIKGLGCVLTTGEFPLEFIREFSKGKSTDYV